jgi:hypothetical protein
MSAFRIAVSNQARQIKRLGVRYQSQLVHTEFEAEREAIKHHATGKKKKKITYKIFGTSYILTLLLYLLYRSCWNLEKDNIVCLCSSVSTGSS